MRFPLAGRWAPRSLPAPDPGAKGCSLEPSGALRSVCPPPALGALLPPPLWALCAPLPPHSTGVAPLRVSVPPEDSALRSASPAGGLPTGLGVENGGETAQSWAGSQVGDAEDPAHPAPHWRPPPGEVPPILRDAGVLKPSSALHVGGWSTSCRDRVTDPAEVGPLRTWGSQGRCAPS